MLRTFTHTAAVFFLSASSRRLIRNAVMQDNMRSQQIQSRALQAIQEDQRAESDTIMKGWEQRQHVYDEILRRQENAILGTLDVVDRPVLQGEQLQRLPLEGLFSQFLSPPKLARAPLRAAHDVDQSVDRRGRQFPARALPSESCGLPSATPASAAAQSLRLPRRDCPSVRRRE